ncbi:hypothetical protein C8R47DRAFT_1094706 [Mycena vitilis]|nr:hypothetical protein C8R47DRAFT_1094706 [Mycena vitilis]
MHHWMVLVALSFPLSTLAAFIVDNFAKPALTCTPFLIQWQGGKAPWTLSVLEASNSAVLENLGTLKVTSFNWNVDLAAGTTFVIQLQDSLGAIATSQTLTIQSGSTDCALSTAATQQTTTTRVASATSTFTTSTSLAVTTSSSTSASVTASSSASSSTSIISESPTTSSTIVNTQSSSSSSPVIPAATSLLPSLPAGTTSIYQTVVSESSTASQSGIGAAPTVSPLASSALKTSESTPIGVILGVLIPGLLLLLFFCIFLFRRRKKSVAGIEELSYPDPANTPAWFMRPAYHSESAQTSYDIQSSGSYGTAIQGSRISGMTNPSIASSYSISRASPFPQSWSDHSDSSTTRGSETTINGQRMQAFTLPAVPTPYPTS